MKPIGLPALKNTERLRHAFVIASMANLFTLPALGASLLVAVAGGIQLGESTIGMINPIHFQGPAVHPRDRGAAVEAQLRSTAPTFASHYGWDQGRDARLQDCGGCEAIDARDAYAEVFEPEDVTVHRASIHWDEPAGDDLRPEEDDKRELALRDLDAELKARVVRYAYYQIEEEPAEAEVYVEASE